MQPSFPFHYVEHSLWHPQSTSFNGVLRDSTLGNGHCFMIGLMLWHLLLLTRATPAYIYGCFALLSDDERLSLIYSYSCFLLKFGKGNNANA